MQYILGLCKFLFGDKIHCIPAYSLKVHFQVKSNSQFMTLYECYLMQELNSTQMLEFETLQEMEQKTLKKAV
jgi:hypothetical protein